MAEDTKLKHFSLTFTEEKSGGKFKISHDMSREEWDNGTDNIHMALKVVIDFLHDPDSFILDHFPRVCRRHDVAMLEVTPEQGKDLAEALKEKMLTRQASNGKTNDTFH